MKNVQIHVLSTARTSVLLLGLSKESIPRPLVVLSF